MNASTTAAPGPDATTPLPTPGPNSASTSNPPPQWQAYLDAALALHGYHLSESQYKEVKLNFERFAAIASPLMAVPLDEAIEPLPVYRPGLAG